MRLLKVSLSLALISGSCAAQLFAAKDSGLPGEILSYGSGARAMGMGRAYTGVSDDVDALFWNPAGIATYRSSQLGFQYTPMQLGGAHQHLAYSQPMRRFGVMGLGVINLHSGDVPRVDSNNIENGSFNNRETAYQASYAYRLKSMLSLGTTLKMVEKITDGRSARGFGLDAGGMWMYKERVRTGLMLRNLVPPSYSYASEKETFPTIARLGSSVKFFEGHMTAAFDLEKTLGTPQGMKWYMGAEGQLANSFFLRFGVDSNEYSTGFGVRFKNFEINYAAGFQDVGLVNRTSLKMVFGGYEVDVKASPRVFSPMGLRKTTTFKLASGNRERVTEWILTVRSGHGEVVRSFNGYNAPPKTLEWDGKDAQGQVVPEGEYTYRFSVTDNKNVTEVTPARSLKILSPTPFEIEAK